MQRPHPVLLGTRDGTARRLNAGDLLAVRRPDFELASHARPQYGRGSAAVFPCCVHFYTAAGFNFPWLLVCLAAGLDLSWLPSSPHDVVPEGLYWMRTLDCGPALVTEADLDAYPVLP